MPKTKTKTTVKKSKRTFVLLSSSGHKTGRYKSHTPSAVAKKIGLRVLKDTKKKTAIISIQEVTLKSKKKIYKYKVTLMKHDKPKEIKKGKSVIKFHHFVKVKSVKS